MKAGIRFDGRVWRDGKWWLVEVPALDVMTQGKTRKDAFKMIVDAIQSLAEVYFGKGSLAVEALDVGGDRMAVRSPDVARAVAFMLRRQREASGLSLADVAGRLGAKSRNAFARYEQGTSVPTIDKLAELLAAVGAADFGIRVEPLEEAAE